MVLLSSILCTYIEVYVFLKNRGKYKGYSFLIGFKNLITVKLINLIKVRLVNQLTDLVRDLITVKVINLVTVRLLSLIAIILVDLIT